MNKKRRSRCDRLFDLAKFEIIALCVVQADILQRSSDSGCAQISSGHRGSTPLYRILNDATNMGIIEGMHISTAEKQYAQTYHLWRTNPQGHIRFTNGETKSEVRQRLISGLCHHATNTPHQNIGISSHGIIISQILFCFGLNQTDIPNGAILHISNHNNNWLYHDLSV